jgi:hypothetical protein
LAGLSSPEFGRILAGDLVDLFFGQWRRGVPGGTAYSIWRKVRPTSRSAPRRRRMMRSSVASLPDVAWAMFASRSYVANHGQPERLEDIHKHAVIGFGGLIVDHPAARWLRSAAPDARVAAICTTTPALVLAVKSGAGGSAPGCRRRERTRSCPANGLRPAAYTALLSGFSPRYAAETPRASVLRFRQRGNQGISPAIGWT